VIVGDLVTHVIGKLYGDHTLIKPQDRVCIGTLLYAGCFASSRLPEREAAAH